MTTALVVAVGLGKAFVIVDASTETQLAELSSASTRESELLPGDTVFVERSQTTRLLHITGVINPRPIVVRFLYNGVRKPMAANIDQALILASVKRPSFSAFTVDGFTILAELNRLDVTLLVTKQDLAFKEAESWAQLYRGCGYRVLSTSLLDDDIVNDLHMILRGKRTMLLGNSGVGKSTLFRYLGGIGAVSEVSSSGLGRQTTTSARLVLLGGGGFVMDRPGIRASFTTGVANSDIAHAFIEFRPWIPYCQFTDCRHTSESVCGVRMAVSNTDISKSRYASYIEFLRHADRVRFAKSKG